VVQESAEEIADQENKPTLKEASTTISFVLGVGMSSVAVGHHCSTTLSGRNGSRQACESHFHQKHMAGTGACARRPWPGKRITASMKMDLAEMQRVQREWRRNGGRGRSDRVL
jgi:hypothetical protein